MQTDFKWLIIVNVCSGTNLHIEIQGLLVLYLTELVDFWFSNVRSVTS